MFEIMLLQQIDVLESVISVLPYEFNFFHWILLLSRSSKSITWVWYLVLYMLDLHQCIWSWSSLWYNCPWTQDSAASSQGSVRTALKRWLHILDFGRDMLQIDC